MANWTSEISVLPVSRWRSDKTSPEFESRIVENKNLQLGAWKEWVTALHAFKVAVS
jgi:hypothetical protein